MTFCKVQVYKISQRTEEMLQTLFTLHVPFPTQWGLHPGLSRTEGGGCQLPSPGLVPSAKGPLLLMRTTPSPCRKAQRSLLLTCLCVPGERRSAVAVLIEMLVALCG